MTTRTTPVETGETIDAWLAEFGTYRDALEAALTRLQQARIMLVTQAQRIDELKAQSVDAVKGKDGDNLPPQLNREET